MENEYERVQTPPNKRPRYTTNYSKNFINILKELPDELLSVKLLFDLSIPDVLTVCETNTILKKNCEKHDFWKKFFEANKSKKRSSGISTNEHHLIELTILKNTHPYDTTAQAIIDKIEPELLKADEDIKKGIVCRLLYGLREDLYTEGVLHAIENGLFVKEPILVELIDTYDGGRPTETVREIYTELYDCVKDANLQLVEKIVPILDAIKDLKCFEDDAFHTNPTDYLDDLVKEVVQTPGCIQEKLEIIRNIGLIKNYSLPQIASENYISGF
jgi:hypothetical protein